MSNQAEPEYPKYDITFTGAGKLIDSAGREVDKISGVDGTHRFVLKAANTKMEINLTHKSKTDPFPILTISFTDTQ